MPTRSAPTPMPPSPVVSTAPCDGAACRETPRRTSWKSGCRNKRPPACRLNSSHPAVTRCPHKGWAMRVSGWGPMAIPWRPRSSCARAPVGMPPSTATFSLHEGTPTAPAGVWEITLRNEGPGPLTFDAFIERDDALLGWRSGLTQSHLEDAAYDASQRFDTHPGQSSPVVRRSGTFNSIATGAGVLSVGGTRLQASPAEHWARYSAPQPDPDAARPAHSSRVVKAPKEQAVSDENPVLRGLRAAGTRAGATVRLVGTSSAAPQVARRLLNQSGAVGH